MNKIQLISIATGVIIVIIIAAVFIIKDEEDNVFPHVIRFIQNHQKSNIENTPISFEKEHSNVEMKLSDLKNLLIKYLEPVYDNNDFNEFVSTLYQFEMDIIDHARIEDHILVPQINELKKSKIG